MTDLINDRIAQEYIDNYLECGRKIHYSELTPEDGVKIYYYDELPREDVKGYPISSDYELDGRAITMREIDSLTPEEQRRLRLRYYYMSCNHELYVGTTGSGKTTGCVEPQLRAVANQHNKPHLFFTDPKGELYDRNAEFLKAQGYRLYLLNFKDLALSDRWNPLVELYDLNQKTVHVIEQIKPMASSDIEGYALACAPSELSETCYEFNGFIYPEYADAVTAADFARDAIKVEMDSLIQQLVNMFVKVQSAKDPTWEYGAQETVKGIIYAMLEDAVSDPLFTKDMMTIKTIQDYYLTLRDSILGTKRYRLNNHPLMEGKSPRVISCLNTAFDNAENTMRSYCGVFDNSMREWFSGHILALTTGNTVDIDSSDDSPFAVFVVTRDYEKSDFQVAGLFIDWVYRTMLIATEEGRNHRAVHFMLDEFGNIPEIRYFENKIATARSRNIWFHLAVQSYKQLDAVYGELRSCIIRDNCNSQVFLGSQNYETKETFSRDCGKHNIPTLNSVYHVGAHELAEVRIVPISDIDNLKVGQAIIKRLHSPIIFGEFIRSYVAGRIGTYTLFNEAKGLTTLVPHNYASFMSPQYTFHKVRLGGGPAPVKLPTNPFRF